MNSHHRTLLWIEKKRDFVQAPMVLSAFVVDRLACNVNQRGRQLASSNPVNNDFDALVPLLISLLLLSIRICMALLLSLLLQSVVDISIFN